MQTKEKPLTRKISLLLGRSISIFVHSPHSEKTPRFNEQRASDSVVRSTIGITSFNVEGVVPNLPYLKGLSKTGNILCLQEIWLWHFEKDNLKLFLPDYDCHTMCTDSDNFISSFHAPRGKAGVAILWPTDMTKHIKRLPDGNNRIIAIEVNTDNGLLCIINCYMPSMDSGSSAQYTEHLDIIQSIIDKYNASHKTVVCGDFNGTLLAVRSNPHDRLLRTFCEKKCAHRQSWRLYKVYILPSLGKIFFPNRLYLDQTWMYA